METHIVVFKDGTTDAQIDQAIDKVKKAGGTVTHVYKTVLRGFAATMSPTLLADVKKDSLVAYTEQDSAVTTQQ